VNVAFTSALVAGGVRALGANGASFVRAHKRPPSVVAGGPKEPVDFGLVGDVDSVDAELIAAIAHARAVPVIATLGVDERGQPLNINADTVTSHVARALAADVLLLVTKVGGVFRSLADPSTRIARLDRATAGERIADGTIQGGMIPKVEEALASLAAGVKTVAIVSPLVEGAFLAAVNGDDAHGTRIVP
jgi:acetylglutamate kinase